MKSESDVVAHVAGATGVAEQEVRRVIEAAFGFLRSSALAGEAVSHPSLGAIRPRQREKDGVTRMVYRFDPDGADKATGTGRKRGGDDPAGGRGRGGTGEGGRRRRRREAGA